MRSDDIHFIDKEIEKKREIFIFYTKKIFFIFNFYYNFLYFKAKVSGLF